MNKYILSFIIGSLTLSAQSQSFINQGPWRGVFKQPDGTAIPFNFEVKGNNLQTAKVYLVNGPERFATSGIAQKGDSLFIAFDQFDNELALRISDKKLTGLLRKKDMSGRAVPVEATFGETYRFADNGEKPGADISGKYDVTFKSRSGDEEKRVGLFTQNGSRLNATFLSITGDSR